MLISINLVNIKILFINHLKNILRNVFTVGVLDEMA